MGRIGRKEQRKVQYVRIILWVVLLFGVLVFSWANWDQRVAVTIWDELIIETNAPALMITTFLLGFLPLWFLHRTSRWRLNRRVRSLEKAIRDSVGTSSAGANGPLQPDATSEAP
jgi:uncharacterized membrane protein